ncbi:hypothetical protein DS608_21690 [Salmonella enterica subsp. enterica serovar Javiana]|nr:hypothetical protein [Salmonella enterica subsp. enterica serovar Javiana]
MSMKPIRGGNRDTSKALASIDKPAPARLQLNIHPDLHKLLKTVCFNNEVEMSDVVLDGVRDYLLRSGVNPDDLQAVWWMKPKDW